MRRNEAEEDGVRRDGRVVAAEEPPTAAMGNEAGKRGGVSERVE